MCEVVLEEFDKSHAHILWYTVACTHSKQVNTHALYLHIFSPVWKCYIYKITFSCSGCPNALCRNLD